MKRILVVDDDSDVLDSTKRYFEACGNEVDAFPSAIAALTYYRHRHPMIDAVVTDWNMPRMNGIELAQRLRAISETPIKIIMLTANAPDASKINTDLGKPVDMVLQKPIRPSIVLSLLDCTNPLCNKEGPSHIGSRLCKSGSLASGGTRSHCSCDICF